MDKERKAMLVGIALAVGMLTAILVLQHFVVAV